MADDSSCTSIYQTPDSVIILETEPAHEELEPEATEELGDIGASPVLGPVTRSGRKRKNAAPVKSSGKKKNKMMTARSPRRTSQGNSSDEPQRLSQARAAPLPRTASTSGDTSPTGPLTPTSVADPPSQKQDIAALLAAGLQGIQSSMKGMETRLAGKIDHLENKVITNERGIEVLTSSVDRTVQDLVALRERVARNEENMTSRVADLVRAQAGHDAPMLSCSSLEGALSQARPGLSQDQLARYWSCRRALRLWPIRGVDLTAAVKKFLVEMLGVDPDDAEAGLAPTAVEKVVDPRSKVDSEVVATFRNPGVRDSIKSLGFKLEGKRAGIRIEIPVYLRSDFQVLQNLSYRMKMAHQGMKRSIKFDDENHGLVLDIQVPGQDWRRIRPDQAREAKKSDPRLRSGPLEMTSDMIAGTLTSTAGPPILPISAGPGGSAASSSSLSSSSASTSRPSALTGSNTVPLGNHDS